ncbi:hypothetical protein C8Q77DRAFT_710050 [Trametes polyzona]|nr:hypothetical protein C8Q77DRAFT_710050 [Trametes polyzona]
MFHLAVDGRRGHPLGILRPGRARPQVTTVAHWAAVQRPPCTCVPCKNCVYSKPYDRDPVGGHLASRLHPPVLHPQQAHTLIDPTWLGSPKALLVSPPKNRLTDTGAPPPVCATRHRCRAHRNVALNKTIRRRRSSYWSHSPMVWRAILTTHLLSIRSDGQNRHSPLYLEGSGTCTRPHTCSTCALLCDGIPLLSLRSILPMSLAGLAYGGPSYVRLTTAVAEDALETPRPPRPSAIQHFR